MKNLIIYYSKTGNNEYLAKEISNRLACKSEKILEKKKRTMLTLIKEMIFKKPPEICDINNKINQYNNIIIISPVWGGIIASPVITFINKYKNEIQNYMVITVSGGALGENKGLEEYLSNKIGKKPKLVTQILINDLLPNEKKNKTKYTSSYKITKNDINVFDKEIEEFINVCI